MSRNTFIPREDYLEEVVNKNKLFSSLQGHSRVKNIEISLNQILLKVWEWVPPGIRLFHTAILHGLGQIASYPQMEPPVEYPLHYDQLTHE